MFDTLAGKIGLAIITAATALFALFGITSRTGQRQEQMLGAQIPVTVALFETSLQSKITSSASSMTLVNGSDRNGTPLSGYMCFTLDEGTASVEYVCGTASSTDISSLARGLDPLTGSTSVASLKKEHRRGATVKITNFPQLAIVSRILNGNETLPNLLVYDGSISTTTQAANTAALASIAYVNGIALQGAPTATTSIPGIVQIGTTAQIAAGTGITGVYTLVPAGSLFNQTPQSATTVPVTSAAGKLAQGFLDLTVPWTFTSTTTLAATTTNKLVLSGVGYAFPSTQGGASTALINNGSGTLSWGVVPTFLYATSTGFSSSLGNGTYAVLATATTTFASAGRAMVTSLGYVYTSGVSSGATCDMILTTDGVATTTVGSAQFNWSGGGSLSHRSSVNFTYVSTSTLSSGLHVFQLLGSYGTAQCNYSSSQLGVFNAGN